VKARFRPLFTRKSLKILGWQASAKTGVVLNNATTCSILVDESACARVLIARVRPDVRSDLDRPREVRNNKTGQRPILRTHRTGIIGPLFKAAPVALPQNARDIIRA
jgi:hypothetical protein